MWGMVWMYGNAPLSFWLKSSILADYAYPHLFILITTFINACMLGLLIAIGVKYFRK
jgi:hypothetical protein